MAARMPYVYMDTNKGRPFYLRRFPSDVTEITGEFFKHTWPTSVSRPEADRLSVEQAILFDAQVAAARDRAASPEWHIKQRLRVLVHKMLAKPEATAMVGRFGLGTEKAIRFLDRMPDEAQPVREMVDVTPRHDPISLDRALADWKKRHGPWRDADAEKKATKAKTTAAELLFASAGTSDMAEITTEMLQAWKDDLEGRQAHDLVAHIKGLYTALAANNRPTTGNPADKIETPRKPDHKPRAEFSDQRATLILTSALASDDPLIKWGPMIMAFTGTIISEFVYAPTSEFKLIDGVWVWHLGENRVLKTGNRPRVIPLHEGLIRPDFLGYVRSRGDGLLFDIDNTRASAALMAHLRGDELCIEGADQCNYSWRHRFISTLVAKRVEPSLRRYLEGHGAVGVDELHYIHHHLPEMIEAIRGLKDPTA